ncbi:DUF115 domain-containing protein [Paenibacillus oenotherae]|uniref:DUF115 domain-containing protein n=1 Tax=Paenibacillus oenotherae TaxID=1435645 RepID=A0ABS7D549_9BACL|nr:6-hydroxymethylpterin diphosphokinase MptE-like protein [Paenibacillus oenotherae]MBW7474984.1 DUF115 domain-containing protein [Paenibacillus oenotherae]
MRKYAADNLLLLRQDYKNVYDHFRGLQRDAAKVEVELAKNGMANVTRVLDDRSVRLYSQYDPVIECSKWLEQVSTEIEEKEHVLVFGLGLGYHLEALLSRFPEKKFYIYEPDNEIFISYIEVRDMRPALKNKSIAALAIGSETNVMYGITKAIATNTNKGFAFITIPVYQRLHKELLAKLRKEAEAVLLDYRSNLATVHGFREEWPRNIIKNFVHILRTPDISLMKDSCKSIPAIIVGSGPSLKDDIPMLKEIQHKCMIISAGTSVQALAHHGITPDLVVSIDGGHSNYVAFEHIDLTSIPLLYSSFVHYKIPEKKREESLYVGIGLDTITPYLMNNADEAPVFYSTASVTGTSIQAANYLGCHPIVFTGQDMSFPNDSFYTEGVKHIDIEKQERTVSGANESVPNVSGGTNRTTKKMITTLNDLEALLKAFNNQTYINASRYGAVIEGTTFKLLEDWAREYPLDTKLERHWFKAKIAELKWNKSGRVAAGLKQLKQLESEFCHMDEELSLLIHHLEQLQEQDSLSKDKRTYHVQQVEQRWTEMSSTVFFEKVYSVPIRAQIMVFQRHVPEIINENDLVEKSKLLVEHLGRLVRQMKEVTPKLLNWTRETIETAEVFLVEDQRTTIPS